MMIISNRDGTKTINQVHEKLKPGSHHCMLITLTSTKLAIPSPGQDTEQLELSCVAGGNARWRSRFRKQFGKKRTNENKQKSPKPLWQFLIKLKICLPCNPSILPLGIYPREVTAYVHVFLVATTWKQPKCPSASK